MQTLPQKYRQAAISELTPHPRNPNQGDVGAIHQSIEANGWYGAVVVQKSTQFILAGNHRVLAAGHSGAAKVPILEVDCDDETALRILLADNRIAALAQNDTAALAILLTEIASRNDLAGTGYDGDDVDDILRRIADDAGDYSTKIESPIYEPTGDQPPVAALADTTRRDELLAEIDAADVPAELRAFLALAAHRHTRFDYETIANYYAHAEPDVKRLMEASALVIIDYDQAVERGFVRLHDAVDAAFSGDYPNA